MEMESTVDHDTGRTRVQEESIDKREMSETVCAIIYEDNDKCFRD